MEQLQLGTVATTSRIYTDMLESYQFQLEINAALKAHRNNEFEKTVLCDEDIETNKEALIHGDRILNAFGTSKGKIWIITEWDRSYTTILYPDEY